jgi:hypothetical protein
MRVINRQACDTEPTNAALQAAWKQLLGKALPAAQAIDGAVPKKAKKLKRKASTALQSLLKKTDKLVKKGKVTASCQATVTADVGMIQALLSGL